ncbi:acyl-CoA-binding protein-like [Herrania umbratica]|uniref:Acyl-CoA-binding protein-like n=1 Tax=Herrania umbratica TaxID=108875 RepID=A0A6J0ZRB1_9ROSI|nr:acyl-CoA-binding protein-like [Herrania umbratica]
MGSWIQFKIPNNKILRTTVLSESKTDACQVRLGRSRDFPRLSRHPGPILPFIAAKLHVGLRKVFYTFQAIDSPQRNMALQEEFKESADKAKALPPTTKDADKLTLYGLYKQATVGNVNTDRPGIFSPTDRAKWDAWKAVEEMLNVCYTGKTKEEAMTEYIAKVKELQGAAAA